MVQYLVEELGLGQEGANKVVGDYPRVLSMSVEENLKPTVPYLAEELGLGREGTATTVGMFPSVLDFRKRVSRH